MGEENLNFVTLFDSRYAAKGSAMIRSLRDRAAENGMGLHGWVFLLDGEAWSTCSANLTGEIKPINFLHFANAGQPGDSDASLKSWIRSGIQDVSTGKKKRGEFCWSLASTLTAWVARNAIPTAGKDDILLYVDADEYFFGDPTSLLHEMRDGSVGAQPHRHLPRNKVRLGCNGRYNVGIVAFRMDSTGRNALDRWSAQVMEWCREGFGDPQKYQGCGDQLYLDEWPSLLGNKFVEFSDPLCVAPWNLGRYSVSPGPAIDGMPVVCYHFHEFKDRHCMTWYPLREEDVRFVYDPYVATIESFGTLLSIEEGRP